MEQKKVDNLRTPCLVVYKNVLEANCNRMLERAARLGCRLRPHVKTHKTIEGALLQTGGRKSGIVVSTLAEAQFFASGGFDDILYAVPITLDKLPEAAKISLQVESFHILVDNQWTVDALIQAEPPSKQKAWSCFIMVDCGYHRDGCNPDDPESISLVKKLVQCPTTSVAGIYTHAGHSYDCKGESAIRTIAEQERDSIAAFAEKLRASGVQVPVVGIGSTPTCSHPPRHLQGINEMHPGNYAYYDFMQCRAGSCELNDVAARVFTRVIGHYPSHNMLLIDCGWTGTSSQGKEFNYGTIEDHTELKIIALKQEAGEITSDAPINYDKYPIGKILRIIPFHSCAATHAHRTVCVMKTKNSSSIDAGTWTICKGWG